MFSKAPKYALCKSEGIDVDARMRIRLHVGQLANYEVRHCSHYGVQVGRDWLPSSAKDEFVTIRQFGRGRL